MINCICCCSKPSIFRKSIEKMSFTSSTTHTPAISFGAALPNRSIFPRAGSRVCTVKASMVDSYESSSDFTKRMEQTWLISQQPRPVVCNSCNSNGCVDCKWCAGTGFFIIGDNMLCQVPSRNTTCVICAGKGSTRCCDCKGTGFRAKWLQEPPISK